MFWRVTELGKNPGAVVILIKIFFCRETS